MICEHCGNAISEKPGKDPWCMYQIKDGKVINSLFHPDHIPDGWYDSPNAAKAASKKIDGRTKQARAMKHDDSTGLNQQLS